MAVFEGDPARAARLWGASEALLETVAVAAYLNTPDHSLHRCEVAAARERPGERPWKHAWAEGQATTMEEAKPEGDRLRPPAASA